MIDDLAALIDPECPGCRALLGLIEKQAQIQLEQAKLIDRQAEQLGEQSKLIERQAEQQAAQSKHIESLTSRVAQLEEKLGEHSDNSHKPPSSDPPAAREQRKKRPGSGRSRGGQKGHKGHRRELVPAERVDQFVPLVPKACGCCGEPLMGSDPAPVRHQVIELPPVRPTVTEYQQHTLPCTACGATTTEPLPDGVPTSAFGPRLSALICTLTAHYRLSKDKTQELLSDVLGVDISLGGISRVEARMADALQAPVEEALAYIKQQPVAYIDETGWWQQYSQFWLWAVVTKLVVVFVIRPSRGKVVAQELLGEAPVLVAVSDRYSAYKWLGATLHQLCWAHCSRDFQKMACARDPTASALGVRLGEQAQQLFAWWHRVKAGELKRSSLQTYTSGLRATVRTLLQQGSVLAHEPTAGMCREMLRTFTSMWTFVRVDGVEPTNNDAEREVRHGVVYRRISGGTASARGSRFVERMLTVRASLRRQHRNVLQFLADTADAVNHHRPGPSLLPVDSLAAAHPSSAP